MVALTVERTIDDLISELDAKVRAATMARSEAQRFAREAVAIRAGDQVQAAMIELEETICTQRDWLDANRADHRYPRRRAEFVGETLRRHAAAGEALERAAGTLTWRS